MRGSMRPSDLVRPAPRKHTRVDVPPLRHGQRFGSLRVEGVEFTNGRHGCRLVHVRCECGTPLVARVLRLASGHTRQCRTCGKRARQRWNRWARPAPPASV